METIKHHRTRLEMELKSAYRGREQLEISNRWQAEAMRRIRDLGPLGAGAGYLLGLERLLWRLAPIACVLIFFCALGLFNLDLVKETEMAKLFFDDPVEYVVARTFGI